VGVIFKIEFNVLDPIFYALVAFFCIFMVVVSNMNLHYIHFRKNGFTLEEDLNAPPGCRYKLKSVPYSKNTMFGVEGRTFEFYGFYL
jgi:hypothetical protein